MKKFLAVISICALVFACTPKAAPSASSDSLTLTEQARAGQETYTAKCGRCHELKKVDNYTLAQWKPILDDMAMKAKLTAEEKAHVQEYINVYAKPA